MALRYDLLTRVLTRCAELAGEEGVVPVVKRVYDDRLKGFAEAFLESQKVLRRAESAWAKENTEAAEALEALDQPYNLTRSVVAAYCPHEIQPDALKSLPTDTDKMNAIDGLLGILDDHKEEEWAAEELASSEFGTKAPKTITELDEAITASTTLAEARDDRAKAAGVAWERYLAFKRVVRNACGASSKQYRRIHVRESAATTTEEPKPEEPKPEEPKPEASEAEAGEGDTSS